MNHCRSLQRIHRNRNRVPDMPPKGGRISADAHHVAVMVGAQQAKTISCKKVNRALRADASPCSRSHPDSWLAICVNLAGYNGGMRRQAMRGPLVEPRYLIIACQQAGFASRQLNGQGTVGDFVHMQSLALRWLPFTSARVRSKSIHVTLRLHDSIPLQPR